MKTCFEAVLLVGAAASNRALWWDGVTGHSCLPPLSFVACFKLDGNLLLFVVTVVSLMHDLNMSGFVWC